MSIPTITPEQFTATAYDYVIVGGGTAGLTIAARCVAPAVRHRPPLMPFR